MTLAARLVGQCACCMVGLALLGGCGPKYPPVVPVSGKVMYKSQPVEGATVSFFVEGGTPATGMTKADGTFNLTSYKPNDGAPEGSHKVTVTKIETSGGAPAGESMEAAAARGPTKITETMLLPAPYASPITTPLSFTVTKGQKNHFDIELKDE